jgi:probable rRNA maturation factor
MNEGRPLKGGEGYLGDIAISVDAARRQARIFDSTVSRELRLYLIHGVLHLLGYDDGTAKAARRMHRREEWLLKKT